MNAFIGRNGLAIALVAGIVLFAAFLWLRAIEVFWGAFVLIVIAVGGPTLSKLTAGPIILEFKNRVARQLGQELNANLSFSGTLETKKISATESEERRRQLIDQIVTMRLPKAATPEEFGHEIAELVRLPPDSTVAPSEHLREDDPRARPR